jgi:hypothetical protein
MRIEERSLKNILATLNKGGNLFSTRLGMQPENASDEKYYLLGEAPGCVMRIEEHPLQNILATLYTGRDLFSIRLGMRPKNASYSVPITNNRKRKRSR